MPVLSSSHTDLHCPALPWALVTSLREIPRQKLPTTSRSHRGAVSQQSVMKILMSSPSAWMFFLTSTPILLSSGCFRSVENSGYQLLSKLGSFHESLTCFLDGKTGFGCWVEVVFSKFGICFGGRFIFAEHVFPPRVSIVGAKHAHE